MTRVDARGLKCPWPALRAARALRETKAVEILADDPAAARELAALAAAQGLGFEAIAPATFRIGAPGS
ncbi:sulfurtransferase TusA family protein [Sphingomonas yantingensis]|uniref:tRNA 2-thiouridine synthesizing protein A n=2 Tax=Sphingomonas TaxID=13687 RepID=A0A7W9APZ4_9SPHN|nr:sulfurtransferase TusA family protein [uncultured Sphingomonas sp.]MBB5698484.1 tRNA 2-thiouridine synthesizing protein A [Sphingomonas yantingensis]HCB76197.1 redox protein [Sphingomonas bacterium]